MENISCDRHFAGIDLSGICILLAGELVLLKGVC